jgi:hypothetical protein
VESLASQLQQEGKATLSDAQNRYATESFSCFKYRFMRIKIRLIEVIAKCCHLCSLPCVAPLPFSQVQLSPPPFLCEKVYCTHVYSVWGGGVWGSVGDHIFCESFTLSIWPNSEPTKLLDHPKQKLRRGGGLRQINTCHKVPLRVKFFRWRYFALPYFSTGLCNRT